MKGPASLAAILTIGLMALQAQETSITVLYVSKMPDIEAASAGVGGLPELATLVRRTREASPNVLFLHGGDSLAPSAMSLFDHGTHMIDLLNGLQPDAMAINEREFAYKEDELVLRAGEASFPFLCSNIVDPITGANLPDVADDWIFTVGGFKIGVFALIDPLVTMSYLPDRITLRDVDSTASSTARKLRSQGADLVILLSGFDLASADRLLAEGAVDLVLESSSKEDAVHPADRGLLVRQGTAEGKALMVQISIDRKGGAAKARFAARLVALKDYPPDKDMETKIARYRAVLSSFMDVKVGIVETPMDTTKNAVRGSEAAFGNLVADALRAYYGADIGLVNGGGIRGNRVYPAGTTLTRKDLHIEMPFVNQSSFVSVTGAQLSEALENSFSQIEEAKGRFPQVSGITASYCPTSPVGNRLRSVLVGGRPLKPDQKYSLATIDFLVEGGDGYDVLKKATAIKTSKSSLLLWEVVRLYIERKRSVSPRVEGRLLVECR